MAWWIFLNKNGRDFDVDDDYYVQFDWNIEEAQDFFDQYEVRITEESQVFPFCKNILEKLRDMGHKIYILTARDTYNEEMIEAAKKILLDNEIPYDEIYWKLEDKLDKCQELGIDVMIDDKASTCEKLATHGIKCIYFKGVNNRPVREDNNIKTVTNWTQIYRYFKNLDNK